VRRLEFDTPVANSFAFGGVDTSRVLRRFSE